MTTIYNPKEIIENPSCIVRTSETGEAWQGQERKIQGKFARVQIKTGEDWTLIRMFRHGIDYFAPVSGNGLMVRADLLRKP